MKTPDYQLLENFTFGNSNNAITLERYSFVRPIDASYVPAHVKKKGLNPETEVFCYTRWGIIAIPRKIIGKPT